jgi:uncharacterized repeat protein (TIGR03806 family)
MRWVVNIAVVMIAIAGNRVALAAEPAPANALGKRQPWTTSRVVGSPEPPSPFRSERAYPELRFDRPVDLEMMPDGQRWLVCEHQGTVQSFANDAKAKSFDAFLDIRPKPPRGSRQLWSLAFHPQFATNRFVYLCYHEDKPDPPRCRISRFVVDRKSPPTADPASEFIVCEWLAGEDHWGGCLKFGRDGFLYFSVGDGSGYADGNSSGQDLSDFQASILRIDVDHADKGKAYAVPRDNPFVDRPGIRPEIWAYGLRNVWKMSIDQQTGDLWAGDVGQDLWEMVYKIAKGGNYGWSVTEGTHPFRPERPIGPTPILKPVIEHDHSEFRSVTGGFVYRGQRFQELRGCYVYGDYETGKVWALRFDDKKVTEHRELVDTPLKLVGFAEDAQGELLLLDYTGTIHRLERNPPPDPSKPVPPFPRLLSETGLFVSTKDHKPSPGLIPYSVNAPLWSDHAAKERFLAVPGDGKVEYSPTDAWKFPNGSVLVKTFAMEMNHGQPASRRRLETRLLHLEQDHWRGYTYLWNDQQTDAELIPARGLDRVLTVGDPQAPGGKRQQTWHFPSRAECTLCHTMPVGFVLGLNTLQMNRDHDYNGVSANQLQTLDGIGLFSKPLGKIKPDQLPRLANPSDAKAPLDVRARSYLHANCAHCHVKWGGGNALFQLTFPLALEATGILDTRPMHGDLGVPGARIVIPGDPDRSLLCQRMAKLGPGRMPHVASSVVDEPAIQLVREWIRSLPAKK